MTFLRFRGRRSRPGRKPAFAGDFPDDDRDITEILGPPGGWSGASGAGLPDGGAFPDPDPAGTYRRAIAQANDEAGPFAAGLRQASATIREATAEAETAQQRTRTRRPLPAPAPAAPALQDTPAPAGPRETGPMQRLPRITRVRERPRPQRPPDAAIFIWSGLLAQHIMLCGVCLRSRYADPVTAHMPFAFESLRQSAWVSGWRLDAFTRWACPACQQAPAYHSPRPVIQWDPDALDAAAAGDEHAEFWHRAAAEWQLIAAAAAAANHGRHAAVTP